MRLLLSLLLFAVLLPADIPPGDSRRGEEVFRDQGCAGCHAINGQGGTVGPDLGRRVDRNFTPSLLAATMWNHAPAMWSAMRKQGIVRATLSRESASDLFAFFYSTRFFDKPGDAARGKALFTSKRCAECHGITSSPLSGAPPVARWQALGHPIVLAGAMWNHAGAMREAFQKKGIPWQPLTGQELSDLLVYLRNLPETRNHRAAFHIAPALGGEAVFQMKCANCHHRNLETKLRTLTLTEIAAEMWNHAPAKQAPVVSEDEMSALLGYVWMRQFAQAPGNAGRGKRVFEHKKCAGCHTGGAGPNLAAGKPYSDLAMLSALWEHGPRMMDRMREKRIAWPRFEAGEMGDLIAYLNSIQ